MTVFIAKARLDLQPQPQDTGAKLRMLTTVDETATTPDPSCGNCGTGGVGCACVDVTSFTR
jgi:hypothetical protein